MWPLTPAFAEAVNAACERTGALLVADEIQCGLGRTGRPFHSATLGLRPDLMALGKALGAGMPVGAILMSQAVADAISPGDHGTTYGGNLSRAAPRWCSSTPSSRAGSSAFGRRARASPTASRPCRSVIRWITDVRGAGLMRGFEMPEAAATRAVELALAQQLLVNRTAGRVVRLLPPLNVSDAEIDEGLQVLDRVLEQIATQ